MFRRLPRCAVPGYAPICLDSNDPETVACGFQQRLAREVPEPDPVLLAEFAAFCKVEAEKLPIVDPMDFDTWINSTSYNQARKDELARANESNRGGPPPVSVAQKVAAFVKTEFYCALKHCRWIASRCDRFKVFAGPAAKTVESVIYEMPEFIKHTPVPERPAKVKALVQAGRRYYLTDFTAFESHFVPKVMMACECIFYSWILQRWSGLPAMIRTLTGTNKLRTPIGVRGQLYGRRMSGEMFTSVGNGITNLMLAKFIAHKQGKELLGFVEGDDGLFATDAVLTADLYKQLGFTIKIVEVDNPCTAIPVDPGVEAGSMAFCGLIFSPDGSILKDYRKFFQGFGWTSSFITAGDKVMAQLLRCKALSACYETPQCPIIGAMARYALRCTRGVLVSSVVEEQWRHDHYNAQGVDFRDERNIPKFEPSWYARDLYARIFGINEDLQLRVEAAIEAGDFSLVGELLPAPQCVATYADRYVVVT